MKRHLITGLILAVGLLTAASGALAMSATTTTGSTMRQVVGPGQDERQERRSAFLDRVAQKLGVTPERLRQAFAEARSEMGIPSVGERSFELRQRARDGEFGPRGLGPRDRDGEPVPGRFIPGGFGGRGPVLGMGIVGRQMEIAASAIGIAPDQLREELRGSTLEAVARAHGVDPQAVASALQINARQRLNEAVANGTLSQEQADRMHQGPSQAIERLMTMQVPDRPMLRERPFRDSRD
jgi:hypothetical protein